MNYFTFPGIDTYNTPDRIINYVALNMGIDRDLIISKKRNRKIIIARQTAMYLICKKFKNKTLNFVGNYFNADHATVIYSNKQVGNAITTELKYRERIKQMELILRIP